MTDIEQKATKRQGVSAEVKAKSTPKGKSFTAIITTDSIDRDREVLMPGGMDTTDFEKNPIVFWNHDYNQPIAGNATIKRIDDGKNGWFATATMAKRPEDHPEGVEWFPDTVHSLMEQGIVRGVSVGFDPIEGRKAGKKDIEQFGKDVHYVFTKWKLLEFSVAPLQCNQDATLTAVDKGIISPETCKKLFGWDAKKRIDEVVEKEIDEMGTAGFSVVEKEIEKVIEKPRPRKVYFFQEEAPAPKKNRRRKKKPIKSADDFAAIIIAKRSGRMTRRTDV